MLRPHYILGVQTAPIISTKVPFPTYEMAIVDHREFANLNGIADWVVCADDSALPHSPHPAEEKKNRKEKERAAGGNAVFGPGPRIPHRFSVQRFGHGIVSGVRGSNSCPG